MNTSTVLLFGSFDGNDRVNTFMLSARIGVPLRTGDDLVNISSIEPSVANMRSNQPVDSLFRIRFQGSSPDDVNSILGALREELRDSSDITFGLEGSGYTAVIKPLFSACPDVPMEEVEDSASLVHAYRMTLDISVHHKPYLHGATETLYDAESVTLPAVASLAAMIGDATAPLDLIADFAALEATRFFAGVYPDAAAVVGDFARALVGATWVDTSGTGAAASDDAGYGPAVGGNELWGTEGVCYTDVDVTDLEPGQYLLIVKAKSADGADPGTIGHPYADAVTITGTTLGLYPLGVVTLPVSAVRGAATSTLRLTLTGAGAGDAVYVNALFLIPASFGGLVGWRRTSGHAHTLRWEDELLYADDVGALGEAFGGRQIRAKGGLIVLLAEQATPAPTTAADLSLFYKPLWEQLPSAAGAYTFAAMVHDGILAAVSPSSESGWESYV